MPDVLLLHLNELSEAIVATSLIKRLARDGNTVYCVSDAAAEPLFQFSGGRVIQPISVPVMSFDIAINLSPTFVCSELIRKADAKNKLGFGLSHGQIEFYNDGAKRYYDTRYHGKKTKSNLFQLLYALADLTWQGEGYALGYFPRNRTRKSLTGLATKDARLRDFLTANLKLEDSRIWHIPFKKNVLKHIDETNRCKQIVTDDALTLHAALALRKNVEYIIPRELPYKVEMFGSGTIHVVDPKTIKNFTQEL